MSVAASVNTRTTISHAYVYLYEFVRTRQNTRIHSNCSLKHLPHWFSMRLRLLFSGRTAFTTTFFSFYFQQMKKGCRKILIKYKHFSVFSKKKKIIMRCNSRRPFWFVWSYFNCKTINHIPNADKTYSFSFRSFLFHHRSI